jgi:hypothetical protein
MEGAQRPVASDRQLTTRSIRLNSHWRLITVACTVFVIAVLVRFVLSRKDDYIRAGRRERDIIARIEALGGRTSLEDRTPWWIRLIVTTDERVFLKRAVAVSVPLRSNRVRDYNGEITCELRQLFELRSVQIVGSSHDDIIRPPGRLDIQGLENALPSAKVWVVLH